MRLARVQLQMKQADAALKTLDSIKGEGWTAIVADLRGEILLSKGDKQGARAAGSWREKRCFSCAQRNDAYENE
jgi:predicted negative regulator of RcsB-dependent stress response